MSGAHLFEMGALSCRQSLAPDCSGIERLEMIRDPHKRKAAVRGIPYRDPNADVIPDSHSSRDRPRDVSSVEMLPDEDRTDDETQDPSSQNEQPTGLSGRAGYEENPAGSGDREGSRA